ncbi:Signal transduction histidine kinase [Prochlorococcus marinus str. MIT 9321]|uniref:histidine kinase n=1 Tax=Prochlorococcus marinus str. MIT 9401 TaxID=167551 RepID=A0A0A2B1B5_PROMR|nr:HAMP domain-containing histidine kinase [Prochlorococcus marinus]KGG03152.1 Signal transduction histidine kinase [Prochlorococcus marinus str. MIT 9321]KGG06542.1 Signal transduction histidine kinase [Prochlorococcus marinus str. MIT 9322]KGG07641.1 Signal transduction histidine kinase [Prochlorococcus marinus str. MIT 9401]
MESQITIKKIQDLLIKGVQTIHIDDDTSRRMWWASLEVIQKEFLSLHYHQGGIWVASPLPALNDKKFLNKLQGWLWSPEGFPYFQKEKAGFLPVDHSAKMKKDLDFISNYKVLNLSQEDGYEPFLMIITQNFQCILSITGEKDKKILFMKCDEDSLKISIELIHSKLNQENYEEGVKFRKAINNLGSLNINNQFEKIFWPILSTKLAKLGPNHNIHNFLENDKKNVQITEAKLLSAISHEVRTPLATIRTLISSTLKKYNMDESIRNRLIQIDNECNEQIDRFGLIFNAAELVSSEVPSLNNLAKINLAEIFKKLSPLWNKQLNRRGISLKIDIPSQLPQILSDSEKLELMLRGLIDKNTRGLKEGSTLILELRPAGQKLKLQLKVQKLDSKNKETQKIDKGSDLGPVLNWNPQTGSLQLSQNATQKLLASLGGHVTQRRDAGLTVFFPISDSN